MHTQYLTEESLGKYLELLYPKYEIIHDKIIPNSNCKFRPDFRIEELKLLVEFNGFHHFNSSSTILRDERKNKIYSDLGYKIINIPYFIQLDSTMLLYYFGYYPNDFPISTFPHGFISKVALLPADFCELGIKSYNNILCKIPNKVFADIVQSLDNLVVNGKDSREVY